MEPGLYGFRNKIKQWWSHLSFPSLCKIWGTLLLSADKHGMIDSQSRSQQLKSSGLWPTTQVEVVRSSQRRSVHTGAEDVYPRKVKTYVHIKTYTEVATGALFIYYSQKLETAQMSFNWSMVEHTVAYLSCGIWLSSKEEPVTDAYSNLNGSQVSYALWKKPVPKSYILCDSVYMTLLK